MKRSDDIDRLMKLDPRGLTVGDIKRLREYVIELESATVEKVREVVRPEMDKLVAEIRQIRDEVDKISEEKE